MARSRQAKRDRLDEIARGYRGAQILLTASRLGIFQNLGDKALTAAELAGRLEIDGRGARILCDALVALSLLKKVDGRYRNAPLARRHLVDDAPDSRNAMLLHTAGLYERWGRLYDVVKTGKPVPREAGDPRLRGDEHTFARAMADAGRAGARETAAALGLDGVRRMLDVGGGPGLYAIECARAAPELQATILDNARTVEFAQENIEAAGLADRVTVRAGDVFVDPLGEGYDLILASNLIHAYSFEQNRTLVERCARALAPGGRLAVKDFILDEDRTSPEWCALFAVNMLVNTETGDCFTAGDVRAWFEDAGLSFETDLAVAMTSRTLIGRKPPAAAGAAR